MAALAGAALLVVVGCPSPGALDAGDHDDGEDAGDREDDAGALVTDAGTPDGGVDAGPPAPLECAPVGGGVIEGRLGDPGDHVATPLRRVVVMGGGAEVDAASTTFVNGAGGGDVLVVRATGSVDTYTPYFFEELPVAPAPASVTTLRIAGPAQSTDPGAQCRVDAAEALWWAGGDQSDYLAWSTEFRAAVARAQARGVAIGGTSAGAMVLGRPAFAASAGSVTSAEALALPMGPLTALAWAGFAAAELDGVIVDTHFTARDREGRLIAFMARALAESGDLEVRGLGLDEEAAITIEGGAFRVDTGAPSARVFVYRLVADGALVLSAPLTLGGVERVTLVDGDTGPWPLDLADRPVDVLSVVDGVVGGG